MAGYVFAIGGNGEPVEAIRRCAESGVYSTCVRGLSPAPFEGTLTDYLTMKPGDNIYFFCKRRYCGVGELISVGQDCKYCNYPRASALRAASYTDVRDDLLVDFGEQSPQYRWICTFKGSPYFFEEGIDTDEILTYKPNTFKMLRAFWKISFIKLSDEENASLKELFLLRRQNETTTQTGIFPEINATHMSIAGRDLANHIIRPDDMLRTCTEGDKVKHEMALEAAVAYDFSKGYVTDTGVWDYVSHQVIASPFKPIDYMDKIDVFAMKYLHGTKVPCRYMVAELKKDQADNATIDQVLKYVDWVCSEYAYSDYELIEACIIAYSYAENIDEYFREVVQRYYTLGSHPVRNKQWNALKLLKYTYQDGAIRYTDVTPTMGE